ncbi:MAG: hypothetical protein IPI07_06455 [Flavobacteriales bacterium]|nr:hypothetical protein [Flavobacteriales bacterium]
MDKVFAALLSADAAKVLGALPAIEQRGDARSIRPLLHALAGARDTVVRQRITGMLYEVKVEDAAAELLAALDVPDLEPVRTTIPGHFLERWSRCARASGRVRIHRNCGHCG